MNYCLAYTYNNIINNNGFAAGINRARSNDFRKGGVNIEPVYFWFAVIVIATITEIFTAQLVSIWFAVGGIAALIASLLNLPFNIQMLIFALVAAAALIATRPFVKKHLTVKQISTNADRYINKVGIVTLEINNTLGTGQINVLGSIWTARSSDGSVIGKGEHVVVESIQGVKLIVHRKTTAGN